MNRKRLQKEPFLFATNCHKLHRLETSAYAHPYAQQAGAIRHADEHFDARAGRRSGSSRFHGTTGAAGELAERAGSAKSIRTYSHPHFIGMTEAAFA